MPATCRQAGQPRATALTDGRSLPPCAKYPSTPYWPWSPTLGRGDAVHDAPARFVGEEVVANEKLDGGNTLLHRGVVSNLLRLCASSWTWLNASPRRLAGSGKAWCCGSREASPGRISLATPARAFASAMCRRTSIGRGTGVRAGSRARLIRAKARPPQRRNGSGARTGRLS